MNLVDGAALTKDLVDPALDRLDVLLQRHISALELAGQSLLNSAFTGLGQLLPVDEGEGWTLEIEVPKITVRLTRTSARPGIGGPT